MTACRICGCTDDLACYGSCTWIDDPADLGPLCSICGPRAELEVLARHPEVLEVLAAA